MFMHKNNVVIANAPKNDGIGRYVNSIKIYLSCQVRYTSRILSPWNLFSLYLFHKIVHFPHFVTSIIKLPNQKFITTIQDITPLVSDDLNKIKKLYIFMRVYISFLMSDHIIFTSEYVKNCCLQKFKIRGSYSVIPLGVNYHFFSQKTSKISKDGEYFLIVGRRNKHKNTINMLRAFAQADIDNSCSLIFTGELMEYEKELCEEICNLSIGNRVKFLSDVNDESLVALYQNAVALLFVSKLEGFGLPVLEAFAASCPVITSTTASLPEITGGFAIYADPEDQNAIMQAIENVYRTGIDTYQIERANLLAKTYSWENTAKKTSEIYMKIKEF